MSPFNTSLCLQWGGHGGGPPGGANAAPGGANAAPGGASPPPFWRNPRQNVGTYLDGPAIARRLPTEGEEHELAFHSADDVPSLVSKRGRTQRGYYLRLHLTKAFLLAARLFLDTWEDVTPSHPVAKLIQYNPWEPNLVESFDPRILAAKAASSKYAEDSPNFKQATRGPFQQEWWRAMEVKLDTLRELNAWELVPKMPGMKILPSTWAFRLKRRPDLEAKKFKARFCARGDRQIEGVDVFETWAPVAQWSTVRTAMVLAAKLNLVSVQCDITAAFLHAKLPPDEVVHVHQPPGFVEDPNCVLRLNRCLYGLRQSPKHFFEYLAVRLERQGLKQSEFDPCLFLNKEYIVVTYVDDVLVYGRSEKAIDGLIKRLRREDILLRKEGTAEGYLGVQVERQGNRTTLTQPGLIKKVVEALGLCTKYSTALATPSEKAPLPRDLSGVPYTGSINYASVIGMLLYITGHSRPDCAFAVHQCARYTFEPKRTHVAALKRIGRYLKGTADRGLILDPSPDLSIDCYPDADFAGLWGHEDPQDPHCARSRTGYVITLAGCPVLWRSSLQSEIALSTMEAEYVALSTACKDLFPLVDLVKEIARFWDLPIDQKTGLHVRVHEDNVGALTLAGLEPRRMTLRSKHYAIKYHWFRWHIGARGRHGVVLRKIDTAEQLGDMFTKGLGRVAFQRLRRQLMGW
ncbi:hypothetical protein ACHAWF_011772 [Thalassiosira exigua]